MAELEDKTNQNIQGQFNYRPLDVPRYEYSQLITFSTATNGAYQIISPFGVDSEVNYNIYACSDTLANVYVVADINAFNQMSKPQPAGIPGFYMQGAVTITPADAWVPVKDVLNIQINGLSTGSVQIIMQWRMRADMQLPAQEMFKKFSEPTF